MSAIDCWEWPGELTYTGLPKVTLPHGHGLFQHCLNPTCVNPAHIEVIPHEEAVARCVDRIRHKEHRT